mgnify:CR=1 FL=1
MIKVPATLIDFVLVAIVILAVAWLILGPEPDAHDRKL